MNDLGVEEGLEDFKASDKIALIDADTIAYAAAVGCEIEVTEGVFEANLPRAIEAAVERISRILFETNCCEAHLYFTGGTNFRHAIYPEYKANRSGTRYPAGLKELKAALVGIYTGMVCVGYEADDVVVALKRSQPDKYVLCAVDKDVYKSVEGEHWNYYYSEAYGIHPKWVRTTRGEADEFPFIQCLMGDTTDNIKGCPGIGPKKALSALVSCKTELERWEAVVKLFKSKGLTEKDAIKNMRLVNMHQVHLVDDTWTWIPWTAPIEGDSNE